MKILVLHPKDRTTDFLIEGYQHTTFNVINSSTSKSSLKRLMNDHDKLIFMGHGDDYGMYGFLRRVIDSTYAYILRQKQENVLIWCNADKFAFKYGLKGFATGMIISEFGEAMDYCVAATEDQINFSNELFAKSIAQTIHLSAKEMSEKMKELYFLPGNPVVKFNRENLHYFE